VDYDPPFGPSGDGSIDADDGVGGDGPADAEQSDIEWAGTEFGDTPMADAESTDAPMTAAALNEIEADFDITGDESVKGGASDFDDDGDDATELRHAESTESGPTVMGPTESGPTESEPSVSAGGSSSDDSEGAPGDIDIAALDEIERQLADVELALERLGDGSYGRCETCGGLLSDDELDSAPAGRFCRAHLPLDIR
jgi:hypothetical protein